MNKLLIATKNKGKIKEFEEIFLDSSIEILNLYNTGINDDVEEDGSTYEENAAKKAAFYAKKSGYVTLSDDGGIEIFALDNKPGIRSRRWLGYDADDNVLFDHMARVIRDLPMSSRGAKFVVAVCVSDPSGNVFCERGEVAGVLVETPFETENKGLPYRRFFFLPEIGKYYYNSLLSKSEMNKYNHRLIALNKLKSKIDTLLKS